MATKLFLRTTKDNGISSYYDMLTTAGSGGGGSETSNQTTSGGTEIAIPNAVFISGRVPAGGVTMTSINVSLWGLESNMSANAGFRVRFYKRASNGTETEINSGFNDDAELGTNNGEMTFTANITDTAFAENDRLLMKVYLCNIGTMGAGYTGTVNFNGANGADNDSFIEIAETFTPKAELTHYTMPTTVITFSINELAQEVGLYYGRKVSAETESRLLTGQAVTLTKYSYWNNLIINPDNDTTFETDPPNWIQLIRVTEHPHSGTYSGEVELDRPAQLTGSETVFNSYPQNSFTKLLVQFWAYIVVTGLEQYSVTIAVINNSGTIDSRELTLAENDFTQIQYVLEGNYSFNELKVEISFTTNNPAFHFYIDDFELFAELPPHSLTADTATFSLSMKSANFRRTYSLNTESASFQTGDDNAGLTVQRKLTAEGGGSSTPLPSTDLELYYDDDDFSDGAVTTWTDRQASGINPTQATAGNKATKGLSGVLFDGNDWYTHAGAYPTITDNSSIVFVGELPPSFDPAGVIFGIKSDTRNFTLSVRDNGFKNVTAYFHYGTGVSNFDWRTTQTEEPICIIVTRSAGNAIKMYVNGVEVTANTNYLGIGQDTPQTAIGTYGGGLEVLPNGTVIRLLAYYQRELSLSEVEDIYNSGAVQSKMGGGGVGFTLTGNDAILKIGKSITAEQAEFLLTGNEATLTKTGIAILTADTQSYSLTGSQAQLLVQRKLETEVTNYSLTGQTADFRIGSVIQTGSGEFVLTGNQASLNVGRVLPSSVGEFSLTLNNANLLKSISYTLVAGGTTVYVQLYDVNGAPVLDENGDPVLVPEYDFAFHLIRKSAELSRTNLAKVITANTGSFTFTGNAVLFTKKLSADQQNYSFVFNPANLKIQRIITADTVTFLTGDNSATLRKGYTLICEKSVTNVTGGATTFYLGRRLTSTVTTYSFTFYPAIITRQSNPPLQAEVGSFTLTGNANSYRRTYIMTAYTKEFGITPYGINLNGGKNAEIFYFNGINWIKINNFV